MAGLPTVEKINRFAVNQVIPAGADLNESLQNVWMAVFFGLKGRDYLGTSALSWTDGSGAGAAAPTLWTPESECDSVSFGNNDQVEHVVDNTDVILGNNSARTWSVLKHANSPIQLLFNANGFGAGNWEQIREGIFRFSYNGFGAANGGADGNTTTIPTATDHRSFHALDALGFSTLTATSRWVGDLTAATQHVVHHMCSADGTVWRVLVFRNGFCCGRFDFDTPRDPVVVDPNGTPHTWNSQDQPYLIQFQGMNADGTANRVLQHSNMTNAVKQWASTMSNEVSSITDAEVELSISGEQLRNGSKEEGDRFSPVPSSFDSSRPLLPIGLWGETGSYTGRAGRRTDVWLGHDTDFGVAEGDTYPADASHQFIAVSTEVYPWNGSVPLVS